MDITRKRLLIAGAIVILITVTAFFVFITGAATNMDNQPTASLPENPDVIITTDGAVNTDTLFDDQNQNSNEEEEVLSQISDRPVAGYTIRTGEFGSRVRYIESETGHVYNYNSDNNQAFRITNTSFQRLVSATWLDYDHVFFSYDNDGEIVNYLAEVDTANGQLNGQVFPQDIIDIVANSDGSEVYYLRDSGNGTTRLFSYNLFTQTATELNSQVPLRFLDLQLTSSGELYAVSKPSPDRDKVVILKFSDDKSSLTKVGLGTDQDNLPNDFASAGALVTDNYILMFGNNQLFLYDQIDSSIESLGAGGATIKTCSQPIVTDENIVDDEFTCALAALDDQTGRNWPHNWFKGAINPPQSIVEIDPEFIEPLPVIALDDSVRANQVQSGNDFVYFIEELSGQLWRVRR